MGVVYDHDGLVLAHVAALLFHVFGLRSVGGVLPRILGGGYIWVWTRGRIHGFMSYVLSGSEVF